MISLNRPAYGDRMAWSLHDLADEGSEDYYEALGCFDKRREDLAKVGSAQDTENDTDTRDVLREWDEWKQMHGSARSGSHPCRE